MRFARLAPLVLFALAAPAAASDQLSNPAFLGIGMQDMTATSPTGGGGGPCQVTSVTRGSGAKAAGIMFGDTILAIEGARVANCDAVLRAVQARVPGDTVKIDLLRAGMPVSVRATLLSRDEILRRRLVGAPVAATELFSVDEELAYDLSANRGKTTIVGWFDATCTSCPGIFAKIADWSRKQADKPGAPPLPLAVVRDRTMEMNPGSKAYKTAFKSQAASLDVPLAVAPPAVFDEFTIPDADRVHFTIVDARGVVQYVAPIAVNGADTDAALDELFAAAEQAARSIKQR